MVCALGAADENAGRAPTKFGSPVGVLRARADAGAFFAKLRLEAGAAKACREKVSGAAARHPRF